MTVMVLRLVIGFVLCIGVLSQLTWRQRKKLITDHNDYRSKEAKENGATNMIKMSWNKALAGVAQAWADRCEYEHSFNSEYGENLFFTTGKDANKLIEKVVPLWYNETRFYNYKTGFCSKVCGHYTQVVWAKSYKLGCGMKLCNNLNGYLVVCNYYKAGNFRNVKPYLKGKVCSECQSPFTYCSDSLCTRPPRTRSLEDLLSNILADEEDQLDLGERLIDTRIPTDEDLDGP